MTCSGGLALLVCGASRPLLQRCSLQGRKGGLLLCGKAAAQLQRCSMHQCGEAAVKVSPRRFGISTKSRSYMAYIWLQ